MNRLTKLVKEGLLLRWSKDKLIAKLRWPAGRPAAFKKREEWGIIKTPFESPVRSCPTQTSNEVL